jgi:Gluconate 2-dehydrogenase subunit 3
MSKERTTGSRRAGRPCEAAVSRRDALRTFAAAIAGAGTLDRLLAEQVHQMVAQSAAEAGGTYAPVAFSVHQYRTVARLADLILPMENGAAGAVDAGVPAWIDMLAGVNEQLKAIYVDGVAWLDATMKRRGAADFLGASPVDQAALLDRIAFRRNDKTELDPGIQFFTWVRRMTVDGFYTSRVGMRDVYLGNSPSTTFTVPAESLEYALKRSPV